MIYDLALGIVELIADDNAQLAVLQYLLRLDRRGLGGSRNDIRTSLEATFLTRLLQLDYILIARR